MFNPLPTSYYYPDGTKSFTKPSDGEIFTLLDQNNKVKSVWQWDDFKGHWFDVTVAQPQGAANGTRMIDVDFDLVKEFERLIAKNEEKCECGAKSIGSSKHSTWCAKHKD